MIAVIPIASDGHAIPGNAINHEAHLARLARFHTPYHAALGELLNTAPQLLQRLSTLTERLAELADDLIWKYPELSWKSEYLRFPLRLIS